MKTSSARQWHIYSLSDPRTSEVRYIGWAFHIGRRVKDHLRRAPKERTHKACWLKQLIALGLLPIPACLESGSGDWAGAEQRWIAHFRIAGANLTNLTNGGEGLIGFVFSAESRAKMSAAKKGRHPSPETLAKLSAARKGRKLSAESCAKITASKRGHSVSPETRAKLSAAMVGRHHTPEARAKITAAGRGRPQTEESKAKQRAAKIGRPLSAGHRQKLSEAKCGKKLTEEHKAKIKAAAGGWHHTAEARAKISASRRSQANSASTGTPVPCPPSAAGPKS